LRLVIDFKPAPQKQHCFGAPAQVAKYNGALKPERWPQKSPHCAGSVDAGI